MKLTNEIGQSLSTHNTTVTGRPLRNTARGICWHRPGLALCTLYRRAPSSLLKRAPVFSLFCCVIYFNLSVTILFIFSLCIVLKFVIMNGIEYADASDLCVLWEEIMEYLIGCVVYGKRVVGTWMLSFYLASITIQHMHAYSHFQVLRALATAINKNPETLIIYDPYFCNGSRYSEPPKYSDPHLPDTPIPL